MLFLVLELCACNGQGVQDDSGELLPSRRELIRAFRQHGTMLVIYGASTPAFQARLEEAVLKMKERFSGNRFQVLVKKAAEVTEEELRQNPVMVIGSPEGNPIITKVLGNLPLQFEDQRLTFDKQSFEDRTSVFCLSFYPNPLNPQLPISVVTGISEQALCNVYDEHWRRLVWGSWDYEVFLQGQRMLMGRFSSDSTTRWQIDHSTRFDFSQFPEAVRKSPHFHYTSHQNALSESTWDALLTACEANYTRINEFIGPTKKTSKTPPIDYHIYPTAELKGLMLNNTNCVQVDAEKNCVHAVINRHFPYGKMEEGENTLLLRQRLGLPSKAILEKGLALYFSKCWQMKGCYFWTKRLFDSGNAIPLADLLDEEVYEKSSALVTGAMGGALVAFLIKEWGKTEFLARYASWQPSAAEVRKLEKKWFAQLKKTPLFLFPDTMAQAKTSIPPYLKGFNFTHEGYQIYNGYISRKAAESLAYLKDMGANAAAIVPYTGMRQSGKAAYLGVSDSPGSENDESIIHALAKAKALGMTTLLKPQVWVQGGWPGSLDFESEDEWQKFFEYYYQWILHYALMAEMEGVDIFCLGVEFEKATLSHEAEWREIIQKIRGIYSGKLTYAANWGSEFEKVGFWDLFDYIGLNCYYPLSKDADPSDEALKAGCEEFIKKIEKVRKRYPKPILFTELGYRSVTAPWKNPHAEAGDREFSAEDQARAYEATFQALADKEWCHGLFWWKWSTILDDMEAGDRRFIPYKKPAEQVLRKWYGE